MDDAEAVKWYLLAAQQGYADAQNDLGVMYENGKGIAEDAIKAVKWYRRAATQGHSDAQYNLGFMYYAGSGVDQDDAEAIKWYHSPQSKVRTRNLILV